MQDWTNHFKKVLNPNNIVVDDNDATIDLEVQPNQIIEVEELDKVITKDEVEKAIRKLKSKKAAGSDGIIPEFLKKLYRRCNNFPN